MDDELQIDKNLQVDGEIHFDTITLAADYALNDKEGEIYIEDGGLPELIRCMIELERIPEARAIMEKYKITTSKD